MSLTAALALSGCQMPLLNGGEATLQASPDFATESHHGSFSICSSGTYGIRLSDHDGVILGPHFALKVECLASMEEFDTSFRMDELLGLNEKLLQPATGYEYTLVQFAPHHTLQPSHPDESAFELSATLTIGEQVWEFEDGVPADGSSYLASAKPNAPVILEVTDSGRTQSIDLRSNNMEDAVDAYYQNWGWEGQTDWLEATAAAQASNGATIDNWNWKTRLEFSRGVYGEGRGWLVDDNDRQLLTIEFEWPRENQGAVWNLDPADAVSLGSNRIVDSGIVGNRDSGNWSYRTYFVTFDVAASERTFQYRFEPKGPITWAAEGVTLTVTENRHYSGGMVFQ
ncbi:hypothetical protein [Natronoglycomyces albus]|uniref:Uncharacterized protein n=1 Tax=Natronoglycomyces albus TaxID=2811108 RepID=A0A895XJT2_9ACTN|nr:hypothetical protein [Natronoglycomyces albus]QSB05594.1 hypothetical protein JQS30_01295 [Natronoglycomyces albus]